MRIMISILQHEFVRKPAERYYRLSWYRNLVGRSARVDIVKIRLTDLTSGTVSSDSPKVRIETAR